MAKIVHHRRFLTKRSEGGFHMSIGDIMAALLLVVVLFLVVTITQLGAAADELADINSTVEAIAADYQNTREAIVKALLEEFEEDFERWGAELREETLTIRFTDNGTFSPNRAELTPQFRAILNEFVPRYIDVLYREGFRSYITDVLIEGHTANPGGAYEFVSSMNLAYGRSLNVLTTSYIAVNSNIGPDGIEQQEWFEGRIGVGGYSHGRPVEDENGIVDWDRSRRVDFRVITNADEQLDRILRSVAGE